MRITALAGGVGGAKMVDGFAKLLTPDELSVIVNTGDDFEYLSLYISPDLDTVCYTLAGIANPNTGWGRAKESWITQEALVNLDDPSWFNLGDKDLATHLLRTTKLKQGMRLSEITATFCRYWGVEHRVFPMTDDPVATIVHTDQGKSLGFQEYFVHQNCQPRVKSFEFKGADKAHPVPEAINAIKDCDVVVIAPSNPWVSIDPILAVPGYRQTIQNKPVVAISPIIGGKALKGPAAKMFREMGIEPGPSAVANHYIDLISGFVMDNTDADELEKIDRWRIIALVTDIIMKDRRDRVRLAEEIINFSEVILNRSQ